MFHYASVLLVKQLCEDLYHHVLLMYMIKIVIVLYSDAVDSHCPISPLLVS
jgi:hypothetical protein